MGSAVQFDLIQFAAEERSASWFHICWKIESSEDARRNILNARHSSWGPALCLTPRTRRANRFRGCMVFVSEEHLNNLHIFDTVVNDATWEEALYDGMINAKGNKGRRMEIRVRGRRDRRQPCRQQRWRSARQLRWKFEQGQRHLM